MNSLALPILYSFRRCPYAMRARLALQSANIRCELREVVLRDKPSSMLALSPKGTVPVLLLPDGEVIEESLDIMRWALQSTPSHSWNTTSDIRLSEQLVLIEYNDTEFKQHLDNYKYRSGSQQGEDSQHRSLATPFLLGLEARLENSPWLFGAKQTLSDAAIAPFVRQFANVDREWFDSQPWAGLLRWLNLFLDSPAFLRVMTKYKQWKPGDEPLYFPTSTSP